MTKQVRALFGIDPEKVDDVFEGFHDPSIRWNGFACPGFPREQAERVARWLNRQADQWGGDEDQYRAEWDGDTLVVFTPANRDLTGNQDDERYSPSESDGLYGVGAFAWTWSEVEFPEGIGLDKPDEVNRILAERRDESQVYVDAANAVNRALMDKAIERRVLWIVQEAAGRAATEAYRRALGR